LTAIRRAYSWPDSFYTLRNPNPQYFNLSDYLYTSPYPPDQITLYWQIKTSNEWGTTWGPVWWFITAPVGYVPPLTPFPPSCCSVVENDSFWQPGVWSGDDYTDPYWGSGYVATGGGRWGRQLVVAGDNSVYYEAVM